MGLLRRLFCRANDLPALHKSMAQQRYADARLIAEELLTTDLTDAERQEVNAIELQARNTLAQRNLEEGLFLIRDNQLQRAVEHLQLAQEQASDQALQQEIDQALKQLEPTATTPPAPAARASGSSCTSCGPTPHSETTGHDAPQHPDFACELELTLVSYPEDMAQRYLQKSLPFQQAFLLAHQGEETQALKQLMKLPREEQDDLFDFEVGSLLGRLGDPVKACAALKSALEKNPDHLLAMETLVMLLVALKKSSEALQLVQQRLDQDKDPAFCHAQLASIHQVQGNSELTLAHGQQAIEAGQRDPRILLLTASLLEHNGELSQAEALYRQIPGGGGCSGGPNLHLAEFLLRQKRDLRQILDAFNNACRQEPDNPRWQLRVAQTYLARGWNKKGVDLLHRVVNDPRLNDELRQEGQTLLSQQG